MQCSNKYRYLYERENYDTAQYYLEASINTFSDRTSLSYASAIDLRGLIELDIGHPQDSLKYFEEASQSRSSRG
jgi:tetratricopeptide (TPR) repeat protein